MVVVVGVRLLEVVVVGGELVVDVVGVACDNIRV